MLQMKYLSTSPICQTCPIVIVYMYRSIYIGIHILRLYFSLKASRVYASESSISINFNCYKLYTILKCYECGICVYLIG